MSIHTKEALRDYFHSIHDFIRNSGAGYGMTALKIFNIFYALKILEGKAVELGFSNSCEWSFLKQKYNESLLPSSGKYVSSKYNQIKVEIFGKYIRDAVNEFRNIALSDDTTGSQSNTEITNIYNYVVKILFEDKTNTNILNIKKRIGETIKSFKSQEKTKDKLKKISYFIYHQIPDGLDERFLAEMFNKIEELFEYTDNNNFDVKGKIYKYFIGRDQSAISDLGAYFTDRHITSFIMNEINITLDKDNNVRSMIDPFAGSGGMTISYVNHINDKFNNKQHKLDWGMNDNYKKITHCDMAEDVIKIAGIEFYSICGFFPDSTNQFFRTNSFKYEHFQKYHYVISNPSYGGDKTCKSQSVISKENTIDYNNSLIKNLTEELIKNVKDNLKETKISEKEFAKDFKTLKNDIIKQYERYINRVENGDAEKMLNDVGYITNIELFNEFIKRCTKTFSIKYNSDKNPETQETINSLIRLYVQNIKLKEQIETELEADNERKVNFNTCSELIKNWCRKIIYDYEVITKTRILNHNNLLIEEIKEEEENKEDKKDKDICTKKIASLNKINKKFNNDFAKNTVYGTSIEDKDVNMNDKEACSLVLLMNLLEEGGTCVGVLKEGVFFDSKYSKLRCYLIEKYNVTDVISIDSDAFENTTTKTSILIFKNTGRTTKIQFSRLKVNKFDQTRYNYSFIAGNAVECEKNKIDNVEKELLCTATIEEVSQFKLTWNKKCELQYEFDYSLNYKNYLKEEIECPEGYHLEKLGDMLNYKPKSKRKASFANETGQYKFYTSSDTIKKCDECDFDEEEMLLIMGTGGKGSLFVDSKFSCSADNFVCSVKNNYTKEHLYYIYQYIKNNWKSFCSSKLLYGSVIKNINKTKLSEFQIPIPNNIKDIKPELKKILKLHNKINTLSETIPQKEKIVIDKINEFIGEENNYTEHKLGDICEILSGKPINKIDRIGNKYPYYAANGIVGYVNEYLFDGKYILCAQDGSIGATHLINNKFYASNHVWVLQNKHSINNYYIYVILKYMVDYKVLVSGSVIPKLTKLNLSNLNIRIPKIEILQKYKLNDDFDEIDNLKEELEETKKLYEDEIAKLMQPFKNNISEQNNISKEDISKEDISKELSEEDKMNSDKITAIKNIDDESEIYSDNDIKNIKDTKKKVVKEKKNKSLKHLIL